MEGATRWIYLFLKQILSVFIFLEQLPELNFFKPCCFNFNNGLFKSTKIIKLNFNSACCIFGNYVLTQSDASNNSYISTSDHVMYVNVVERRVFGPLNQTVNTCRVVA